MNHTEELLATMELRALTDRYAMAVDRGDGAMFAAQFTEDGVLEAPRGRFVGREAIASVPAMMVARYDRTHHGVVGLVPVFGGETATAQTYTYARHYFIDNAGIQQCYEMTVRYEDRFTRVHGRWLLAQRVLVLIGEATFPAGRKPLESELNKGATVSV